MIVAIESLIVFHTVFQQFGFYSMKKMRVSIALIYAHVKHGSADGYSDSIDASMGLKGECICPCREIRDSYCRYMTGRCYQPICPIGTYLCCAFCAFSTCTSSNEMAQSTRGRRECIPCPPGHFCDGCDIPMRCPPETINPFVGMSREEDCVRCELGFSPNSEATQCCYNGIMCSAEPEDVNYLDGWETPHAAGFTHIGALFWAATLHVVL